MTRLPEVGKRYICKKRNKITNIGEEIKVTAITQPTQNLFVRLLNPSDEYGQVLFKYKHELFSAECGFKYEKEDFFDYFKELPENQISNKNMANINILKKYRKVNSESKEATHQAIFSPHSLVNFIYHISFEKIGCNRSIYHDVAHENSIVNFEKFIAANGYEEIDDILLTK